ncbi:4-alpha-glucanotransferase [Acetobacter musti]|uniref:4-alpha-glucanotransferase n=1 Tax=Acetobacter musti TaxID=864732 RepID=A0ABX0JRD4_9PROT|nr:4-alpha-glucanotransferase [Acetobacter musti]NHN85348.1 4-alpha-glucanotransferase [Acetobacter musti]
MSDQALIRRAITAGLKVRWRDAGGEVRRVSHDNLQCLLKVLETPADRLPVNGMPPMIVTEAGSSTRLASLKADSCRDDGIPGTAERFVLRLENGTEKTGRLKTGKDGSLIIPPVRETGYHELFIAEQKMVLAVAPRRCPDPFASSGHGKSRYWGLAAQIYALRQKGDGGIGHLGAAGELARTIARAGAEALMLSPVHAMFAAQPEQYSPYSPSSRLFLNVLLADPGAVFDAAAIRAATRRTRLAQKTPERLEALEFVDWPAAAKCRLKLLRTLFDDHIFKQEPDDFAAFIQAQGKALHDHAVFEALHAREAQRGPGGRDWRLWPKPVRRPGTPEVDRFARDMAQDVSFHQFLQWLASRSLQAANTDAVKAGMKIGLIGDLAVGVDPAGSECWSNQHDYLIGLSIGAPPDALSRSGQNWGLTTYSPRALKETGYRAFIRTLRACFSHTGGLRIDHVMGMERLWVIPDGGGPNDGAYLSYPREDMLRLVALEASRAEAVVIGEDLGTVEPDFRKAAKRRGIFGMNVLPFQRDETGSFLAPSKWSETSVALTTTHDLPTIAGWWQGCDIAWRKRLGQFSSGSGLEQAGEERARDRLALWSSLKAEMDRLDGNRDADNAKQPAPSDKGAGTVVNMAIRFVADTNCPLAIIAMEDLLGLTGQPNIPGTISGHPNWCRRYPQVTKTLLVRAAVARRLALLRAERPGV